MSLYVFVQCEMDSESCFAVESFFFLKSALLYVMSSALVLHHWLSSVVESVKWDSFKLTVHSCWLFFGQADRQRSNRRYYLRSCKSSIFYSSDRKLLLCHWLFLCQFFKTSIHGHSQTHMLLVIPSVENFSPQATHSHSNEVVMKDVPKLGCSAVPEAGVSLTPLPNLTLHNCTLHGAELFFFKRLTFPSTP